MAKSGAVLIVQVLSDPEPSSLFNDQSSIAGKHQHFHSQRKKVNVSCHVDDDMGRRVSN
jgi:hypothetical protein